MIQHKTQVWTVNFRLYFKVIIRQNDFEIEWFAPSYTLTKELSMLPQSVGRDSDDSFRTLLGRKSRRILQAFVRQRREMKTGLIRIAEPRTTGHRKNLE